MKAQKEKREAKAHPDPLLDRTPRWKGTALPQVPFPQTGKIPQSLYVQPQGGRIPSYGKRANLWSRQVTEMKMQSSSHSCGSGNPTTSWRALYKAALFEKDRRIVPTRIDEAEKAILSRVRELFAVETDHIEEDQILEDALYALRALRNCAVGEANPA